MHKDKKTGFIGGGNMAEAIIKGLLAGGVPAGDLAVSEPSEARRAMLAERYGIRTICDNAELCKTSDVVVLAVKPQVAVVALKEIEPAFSPGKVFISIMAGVKCAAIENVLGAGARV